jgi:diguanylate cyclase (GGDEF)-like protein
LFADIDKFSHFNNPFGHDAGDRVLINIGAIMTENMRQNDRVGRWGGEEFLGIYSINKEEDALVVAEKFRQLVAGIEIEHNGTPLSVAVSVGVTVVRPGDGVESIVSRADQLMYWSKTAGGNRVTSDQNEQELKLDCK